MLACGAQGCRQRIAGTHGAEKVVFGQSDVLGLQIHAVDTAFDVDGASFGLVGAFIGHDGERLAFRSSLASGRIQTLLCLGHLVVQATQLLFELQDLLHVELVRLVDGGNGLPNLLELVSQLARVPFEMSKFQSTFCQIVLGLLTLGRELFDAPLQHFQRGAAFFLDRGILRQCGRGQIVGRLKLGLTCDDDEQQDQRPHRA